MICLLLWNLHVFLCLKHFLEKGVFSWSIACFDVPLRIRSVFKTKFISNLSRSFIVVMTRKNASFFMSLWISLACGVMICLMSLPSDIGNGCNGRWRMAFHRFDVSESRWRTEFQASVVDPADLKNMPLSATTSFGMARLEPWLPEERHASAPFCWLRNHWLIVLARRYNGASLRRLPKMTRQCWISPIKCNKYRNYYISFFLIYFWGAHKNLCYFCNVNHFVLLTYGNFE